MPEIRTGTGLLDTSVLIDLVASRALPTEITISALTLAELTTGPHATADPIERSRRQERLQAIEAQFDPLPFDAACARTYGRVYAAVVATGRKARGPRAVDLMIAATAIAHELPLYTRNSADLRGLEVHLDIVDVTADGP